MGTEQGEEERGFIKRRNSAKVVKIPGVFVFLVLENLVNGDGLTKLQVGLCLELFICPKGIFL